jgi:transketolase
MRAPFVRTLADLADRDPRVVLLTGDLGFSVIEGFAERHPDRFFNVGVAEQNMIGLATGLAEGGYIPFAYSIATFASLRAYEFIRNGPVLHRLPVRILGVGGGFEYGHAGPTHHALEDVAVLRSLPGLGVIAPADYEQAVSALYATWDHPTPIYYRLGKDDRNVVPGLGGRFRLGKLERVRDGANLAFVTLGPMAMAAAEASRALEQEGIGASVLVAASVAPPPLDDLVEALSTVPLAISVEAHSIVGGLGSLVAEVIAERRLQTTLIRCGASGAIGGESGSESFLAQRHGLTPAALAELARASV